MDSLSVPLDGRTTASAMSAAYPPSSASLQEIVGRSPAYLRLVEHIRKMACNDAPVLIEGETGSGKELAARAMHYLSARRDKPFVPLNCGAIPDALIESELFGHVRGSFTDAKQDRAGVLAHANGGTLFLDEIDTLSAKGQVALLRFLQDRRYRPIGQSCERTSDVRVLAASNKRMPQLVSDGVFRIDLLYRLNILVLPVPPLRERAEDIVPLAEHYLRVFCKRYRRTPKRLHALTRQWLQSCAWPGNIRELENLIHRLVLMGDSEEILYAGEAEIPDENARSGCPDFQSAKAEAVQRFENAYLIRVMAQTQGNVSAAARLAGKERRAFGKLLKKHGIDKGQYRA